MLFFVEIYDQIYMHKTKFTKPNSKKPNSQNQIRKIKFTTTTAISCHECVRKRNVNLYDMCI